MLYRLSGLVEKRVATLSDSNSVDNDGFLTRVEKKTYYLEAPSFQKATTKAKKLVDTIQEIKQVHGEIVEE